MKSLYLNSNSKIRVAMKEIADILDKYDFDITIPFGHDQMVIESSSGARFNIGWSLRYLIEDDDMFLLING